TRLLATAVEKARSQSRGRGNGHLRRDTAGPDGQYQETQNSKLKTQNSEDQPSVSLDLPITAYLPEEYVPDDAVRLRMYQRMAASMSAAQIRDLRKELEDRFGPLPEPATNLLEVLHLKGLAISAGVESIRALASEFAIHTPQEEPMPESLRMRLQRKFRDYVKVSPHQVRIDRAKVGSK